MSSTPQLTLYGHLEIAGRRWKRQITLKRSGQFRRGLAMLNISGSAPGGLPMIQIQVDVYALVQWCVLIMEWIRRTNTWKNAVSDLQLQQAEELLKELQLTKSESPSSQESASGGSTPCH